jgi:hypothetical protein
MNHDPGPPRETSSLSTQMGEALMARLLRLEREQQSLRRTGILLAAGLAASIALAIFAVVTVRPDRDGVFEGREFVLRGEDGIARGTWRIQDDGAAALLLHDRNGVTRLRLTVLNDGAPGLALLDRQARNRVVLGFLPDETGTLAFADAQGATRAVLGVTAGDAATLVFVDGDGVTRAGLGIDMDGSPTWTLVERGREPVRDTTNGR